MRTPDRGVVARLRPRPEKSGERVQGDNRRGPAVHFPAGQAAREGSHRALRAVLPPPRGHRRAALRASSSKKSATPSTASFPAAKSSGWRWPWRWSMIRKSSSSTSRPPASTRRSAAKSTTSSKSSGASKRTLLLTTHYIEEAERLCDRVAIVDHGRVIALGTPRELKHASAGTTRIEVRLARPLTNGALIRSRRRLRLPRIRRHLRTAFRRVRRGRSSRWSSSWKPKTTNCRAWKCFRRRSKTSSSS